MKNIIKQVSEEIAKEIISRPNFDLAEVSGIINFRIKESVLDILLSNVEQEEVIYHKLMVAQSELRVGSKEYISMGYKLGLAKSRKSVANRAINNVRRDDRLARISKLIKLKYGDEELQRMLIEIRD